MSTDTQEVAAPVVAANIPVAPGHIRAGATAIVNELKASPAIVLLGHLKDEHRNNMEAGLSALFGWNTTDPDAEKYHAPGFCRIEEVPMNDYNHEECDAMAQSLTQRVDEPHEVFGWAFQWARDMGRGHGLNNTQLVESWREYLSDLFGGREEGNFFSEVLEGQYGVMLNHPSTLATIEAMRKVMPHWSSDQIEEMALQYCIGPWWQLRGDLPDTPWLAYRNLMGLRMGDTGVSDDTRASILNDWCTAHTNNTLPTRSDEFMEFLCMWSHEKFGNYFALPAIYGTCKSFSRSGLYSKRPSVLTEPFIGFNTESFHKPEDAKVLTTIRLTNAHPEYDGLWAHKRVAFRQHYYDTHFADFLSSVLGYRSVYTLSYNEP